MLRLANTGSVWTRTLWFSPGVDLIVKPQNSSQLSQASLAKQYKGQTLILQMSAHWFGKGKTCARQKNLLMFVNNPSFVLLATISTLLFYTSWLERSHKCANDQATLVEEPPTWTALWKKVQSKIKSTFSHHSPLLLWCYITATSNKLRLRAPGVQ